MEQTQNETDKPSHKVLSVTDLSQYVFCPRQFYLSRILALHRQPPEFVEGTLEHDARRLLNETLRQAYTAESTPDESKLFGKAESLIGKTLGYARKIALTQHPIFTREIDQFIQELSFRLHLEERERIHALLTLRSGRTWEETVRASFPIENEFSVFSPELQLRGRIDEVYEKGNGNLAIRDIKTAPVGFPFDDSNQVQVGAYAMLLAEQESKRVDQAAIYSSRNFAERQVMVDDYLKKRVIEAGQNVRRFLADPELPEILSGPEAVKCAVCFLREDCYNFRSPDKERRGIEALFNSQGKLSLFGDD